MKSRMDVRNAHDADGLFVQFTVACRYDVDLEIKIWPGD